MRSTKKVPTGMLQNAKLRADLLGKEYLPIHGHECTLPIEADPLSFYVNDGLCPVLRRKFRQMFLISSSVPKAKLYFRSSLRIRKENQRHLRYYYYTIHPFSTFRYYWEIIIAFVFLVTIIYMPIFGINILYPHGRRWSAIYYNILNAVCALDIIVSCFTGYLDEKTDSIELKLKKVFKHYLFGYLIIDFIGAFPFNFFLGIVGLPVRHWYTCSRFLRVLRINTITRYLQNLMHIMNVDNQNRMICTSIIRLVVFVEYITYFTFLDRLWMLNSFDLWPFLDKFFFKLTYCSLRTFFLIQPHLYAVEMTSYAVLFIQFILLQLGNIFNALLLARLHTIYNRTSMVSRRHEHLFRQVKEYARYKELSDLMYRILLQYVDFKFGRRIYNEELLLSMLTPHLKDELFFLYSQKLVENVELFKNMPSAAIKRIAVRMKQEIVLPNDVIIQAGHEGSSMYFIIAGIVAVYTIKGKEVCHLTDGANFGEIALLMNETRTASIVATDFCELFKLHRKDFQEAIEPFPEVKAKMIQTAKERLTTIIAVPTNDDIVSN